MQPFPGAVASSHFDAADPERVPVPSVPHCSLRHAQTTDVDFCVSVRCLVQHGALMLDTSSFREFTASLDRAFRSPHNSQEFRDAESSLHRVLSAQIPLRNACHEALRYFPSADREAPLGSASVGPNAAWLFARKSPSVKRLRRQTPSYYKISKTASASLRRSSIALGPSLAETLSTSLVSASRSRNFAPRLRSQSERDRETLERLLWRLDLRVSRLVMLLSVFQPLAKRLSSLQLHPSGLALEDPSGGQLAHTLRHSLCQELVFRNGDIRTLLALYFPHGIVILRELYSRPWHAGPVIVSRIRHELAARRQDRRQAIRRRFSD